jgi:hypothetical protein
MSIAQRTASTALGNSARTASPAGVENAAAGLGDEVVDHGAIGRQPPHRLPSSSATSLL